jgi:hypothetical protein
MTPREIIAEAWAITRREKGLRKWGYFSSFFETLFALKLICYQAYFAYAYFVAQKSVGFFDDFIWLYDNVAHWAFYTIIIVFCILLIIEWFVPHLAMGAIIGLSAKSHKHEKTTGGLVLALYNFFAIFAIHEFLILAGLPMTITICSVILRYIPGEVKWMMVGLVVFFWVLSNILKFFFSFAQPAVVVEKRGIFEAMGQSFKLVVSYLGQIMFLLLLLLVISIRIFLNTIIILIIPGLVFGIALLLGTFLSAAVTWTIASIVAMALIVVASYFFGYLHVFREAVWTITFIELRKHKDLDVIG